MKGVLLTFGCIIAGTLVSTIDPISGLALLVVGGIAGIVLIWTELS